MDYKINVVIDNGSTNETQYTTEAAVKLLKEHGIKNVVAIINGVLKGENFLFHVDNSRGFERIHLSAI